MRLLRNRRGQVALEIDGNTIIKFIRVTSNGPRFDASERKSFFTEYNTLLDGQDELSNILSFLLCSKRGFLHDASVCEFLWERLMAKNFTEMTLQELISVYNKLADAVKRKPRKAFSSKAECITAIEGLDALVKGPTIVQQHNEGNTMSQVDENGEVVAVTEKKGRGKGIGARACELILEGKTNQEVIDIIKAEIEDAHPTPATMAWYRNKLRKEGKLPPTQRGQKGEGEGEAAAEPEAEDTEAEQDAA